MRYLVPLFVLLLFLPMQLTFARPFSEAEFKNYLEAESLRPLSAAMPVYKKDLIKFYESRNYEPVWLGASGGGKTDPDFIGEQIRKAAHDNGLMPEDYNFQPILSYYASADRPADFFAREWQLTNAVMHYIHDVGFGRSKIHDYDPAIFPQVQGRPLDGPMTGILTSLSHARLASYLEGLTPQHEDYKKLREQLANYRKAAESGDWKTIDMDGKILYPGERHAAVPLVRARLLSLGYDGIFPEGIWIDPALIPAGGIPAMPENYVPPVKDSDFYDPLLAAAVAEFQYFHGKKADGVIGPQTISALNVPAARRAEQIAMAMEGLRWLPDDLGKRYIYMNIAAFHVRGVDNGEDAFVMPVIVGEVAHQTPVFSSIISNVKIHPDWVAPSSIARRYLIDKIQSDPDIVYRAGYQVQDKRTGEIIPWQDINIEYLHEIDLGGYQFRQRPGRGNALGLARFSIENSDAIYMHGTPSNHLFEEDQRTFSSGCIRVEDPLRMAKFLLENSEIDESRLEELYYLDEEESPETTYLKLGNSVPVYITYATAWMDGQGFLHFSDDIYGRDEKLRIALSVTN